MIIYIHCKGGDKDNIKSIINGFDEPYVSFNAPFEYKGGFFWFDKDENGVADIEMVEASAKFIAKQIKDLNPNNEDVTLICHSQGGVMAILAAHKINVKKIITLGSDIHKGIDLPKEPIETPIIWFEAENDEVLSEERKQSISKLTDNGYNVTYLKPKGSNHSSFEWKDIKGYLL